MKTAHHRFAVAILALLVLPVPAWGAVTEEDPIKAELDAARKVHADTVGAAKAILRKAFDDEIKKVAAKGDLDGVKTLLGDKEKALGGINLSKSHPLYKQQYAFVKSIASARKPLAAALDATVKKYTKKLELDKATTVQIEWKELQKVIGLDEKIVEYDLDIILHPDRPTAYFLRGLTYFEKGEYANAIADYSQAMRRKDDPVYYGFRGKAFSAADEYEKAILDYNQAIRLLPDRHDYYFYRGMNYSDIGDADKAIENYNQAILLKPDDAKYYYFRGSEYYIRKADAEKGIADFSQVIRLQPDNATAYSYRGMAYESKGNQKKALTDFNQAIRLDPRHLVAVQGRAALYLNKGKFGKAIADYNQAIRLNPLFGALYYFRGYCHGELGNTALANADRKKAKELGYKSKP